MRKKIILICSVCLSRNYQTSSKGAGVAATRLMLNKHCAKCNRTTPHLESNEALYESKKISPRSES
jgi:large subunit ribosomal protein L33